MDVFITLALLAGIPMYIRVWHAFKHFHADPLDISRFGDVGSKYTIYATVGRVHDVFKGATTTTTGSFHDGYGSIQSQTTIRDQFFVTDRNGQDHSFQIHDMDIALAPGQIVSVCWAIRRHKSTGAYFLVHNHATNESYYRDMALYDIAVPHKNTVWFNFIVILFPTVFISFIVWGLALRSQQKRFKREGIRPLIEGLDRAAAEFPVRGDLRPDDLSVLAGLAQQGLLTPQEWTRAKELYLGQPPNQRAQAIDHLGQIYRLYREGALTQSEFNGKKWEILSRESRAVG